MIAPDTVPGKKTAPDMPGARGPRVGAALARATIFLLLCVPAALAPCGRATGGAVIAVTPTRIPLRAAPGESRSGVVELVNRGDEAARLTAGVVGVSVGEDGETVLTPDERCAWIALGMEEIVLGPAVREECPFTLTVPENAAEDAYRFALFFEQAPESGDGVGLTGGVAVLLELEVAGVGGGRSGSGGGTLALKVALPALGAALLLAGAVALARRRRRKTLRAKTEGGDAA